MKMVYPHCCYCEEELWDGAEAYCGMNGYYCLDCLKEMSAEEFLKAEREMIETVEPVAPELGEIA